LRATFSLACMLSLPNSGGRGEHSNPSGKA
jgi:hypothetical protein